jgi:ribonuclease HIII
MLGILLTSDIAHVCKTIHTQTTNHIMVPVLHEQLLQGMHFWVVKQQCLGVPIVPDQFTQAKAYNQTMQMTRLSEEEARKDKDQLAKIPDKFKKASDFKIFDEALDTYLGLIDGSGRAP